MDPPEPAEVYAALRRPRRVSPILVALCVCVLLVPLLSRTGWQSRLRSAHQLARTPPVSPIRYSKEDAERLVTAAMRKSDPAITDMKVKATGPWTEAPHVTRGRPVFFCMVFAHTQHDGAWVVLTPVQFVDATTGEVF